MEFEPKSSEPKGSSPLNVTHTIERSLQASSTHEKNAAATSTVSKDVIPIQPTHAAVVWSSVEIDETDTKVFPIQNGSKNKIELQANIVDESKSFKFFKNGKAVSSMLLALKPREIILIDVMFCPANPGACAGKIEFTHYNNIKVVEKPRQSTIFLYGYAGFGKVKILRVVKDEEGWMWLSLDHMNTSGEWCAEMKLKNTGDLCSYAMVKLTPKALYPAMISSWDINPTELLLGPGEIQCVKLRFRPRQEDLALLPHVDGARVGTITITHVDEPTRQRIRRLYNELKETGRRLESEVNDIVYPLCKVLPGERLIQDLSLIKDPVRNLEDLCCGLSEYEVMLTMEFNANETMTMLNDNADDTDVFNLGSDSSGIFASGLDSYMPSD